MASTIQASSSMRKLGINVNSQKSQQSLRQALKTQMDQMNNTRREQRRKKEEEAKSSKYLNQVTRTIQNRAEQENDRKAFARENAQIRKI